MAEEYEKFEITDYDLENEFNPNRNRKRGTKNQQIYGIWADDSEEEEEEAESSRGRRRGGAGVKKSKDYSAPIGFIAGGIQQAGKKERNEKEEDSASDEEEDDRPKFGGGAGDNTSSESEGEAEPETIRSMAGFRQFQRNPAMGGGVGTWEQHTKGIGAKLLLQMGYQPGKGLGKTLQGISAPVEAHVRKGRGAIGAYGPEKKTKVIDLKAKQQLEEQEKLAKEDKFNQWKKEQGSKNKSRYFYKSVEDVIEKGKKTNYTPFETSAKLSKVTVIDMTGPEKRVLSGYHALGQSKVADEDLYEHKIQKECTNFALPELMHNLNLIVDLCEQDIIAVDRKKCTSKDREQQLEQERDNLIRITKLEKEYIDTLEGALGLVEALVNPENGELTLEESERLFTKIQSNFPSEYKEFGLGDLAPGIIAPLIAAKLKDWIPFVEPTKNIDIVKKWRTILGSNEMEIKNMLHPYSALVWSSVIPSIRNAATMWDPRIHQPMVALLDAWAPLLPSWILDNVLEQIILSKITACVNVWDPLTDTIPIHVWIHPWSGILGEKMQENVYPTIREKLCKALKAWDPDDRSARAMLTPWKGVFPEEDLQVFLIKNIVPKLELRLTEFVINPLQQDLEIFNQVWEWKDLVSPIMMSSIFDKYFFPKWIQVLVIWLNQSPNFDQVSRWYSGWKAQFSEEVLRQTNIKEHFRRALELMQRSTGTATSSPERTSSSATTTTTSSSTTAKPPSLMDMQIDPPVTLEFKELVSQKCSERGIIFAPMPGRREHGKQVYRAGKLFCYIDRSVCIVSADGGVTWNPVSLSTLLEKA